MGEYHCYKVMANVELNIEKIVDAILREYEDTSLEDIDMETVFEYVDNHIIYMTSRNGGKGIRYVPDGPSINTFYDTSWFEIETELNRIKKERLKENS